MRYRLTAVLTALLLAASVRADRQLPALRMREPGFETIRFWHVLPKESGKVQLLTGKDQAHSGEHAARIEVFPGAKTHSITLFGVLSRNCESVYPGETYILTFWARGKGKAHPSVIEYGHKDGKPDISWLASVDLGPPTELTDRWQQIRGEYSPAKDNVSCVAPALKLEGADASATVDDCAFEEKSSEVSLQADLASPVASPGEEIEYKAAVAGAKKGGDAPQLRLCVYDPDDVLLAKTSSPIGEGGAVEGKWKVAPDAKEGIYLLRFGVTGSGGGVGRAVEVMSKGLRQEVVALAKRVKFAKPERMVFVGDSLTDFFRGRNYVDKVDRYLRLGNPGPFETINAGVGGDTITRVAARLETDVLAAKPTHVFLFLGHNDSKVASPDYTKHTCEPEEFERTYRDVIRQIKEKTGAKVTILSATSSVWEICWETAQKRAAEKKPHNLFGKPEELERYNAIAKKLADESQSGYVDLYGPLKSIPDKRSYFTPDGVHISEKGNRLVAVEVLKYLAANP